MTSPASPGQTGRQSQTQSLQGPETSPPVGGLVIALCRSGDHGFSKYSQRSIRLLAGRGVELPPPHRPLHRV